MSDNFMQPQVEYGLWYEIEGDGTTWIPADLFHIEGLVKGETINLSDLPDAEAKEIRSTINDYIEGPVSRVNSVGLIEGWGARLSAPGYLDCTEWAVFDSEEEAEEYLKEQYGDDEEENADDEEDEDDVEPEKGEGP